MARITFAVPNLLPAIAVLVDEMNRHYGTEPGADDTAAIEDALFVDVPGVHMLVALEGDRAVGLASYSYLWPAAGVTRSLYLKELYIAADHRRRGIASDLMQVLIKMATVQGCSRIEWTTDWGNVDAQEFYAHLGPHPVDKLFYRVELQRPDVDEEPASDLPGFKTPEG